MGMPSRSSHIEFPSSHSRLDTVATAEDTNNSVAAPSRQSDGNHENAGASGTPFPTQGDHHTAAQDTFTPPRTVRKKKSSYDLRDEFRHPEHFTASAPEPIISKDGTVTEELGAVINHPSSYKTESQVTNGSHAKRRRGRTE